MEYSQVTVEVLRAFADEHGEGGSPLGVVRDAGGELNDERRQAIATYLGSHFGFSETVFINDPVEAPQHDSASISFFTPQRAVQFSGHAAIGVAWYLSQEGRRISSLRSRVTGEVEDKIIETRFSRGIQWVGASLRGVFLRELVELDTPEAVEAAHVPEEGHHFVWAWVNKTKRIIRARTFLSARGIPEDHGDGTGSIQVVLQLGGELEIHHGKQGSVIHVRAPKRNRRNKDNQTAEVGGRVVRAESYLLQLSGVRVSDHRLNES